MITSTKRPFSNQLKKKWAGSQPQGLVLFVVRHTKRAFYFAPHWTNVLLHHTSNHFYDWHSRQRSASLFYRCFLDLRSKQCEMLCRTSGRAQRGFREYNQLYELFSVVRERATSASRNIVLMISVKFRLERDSFIIFRYLWMSVHITCIATWHLQKCLIIW